MKAILGLYKNDENAQKAVERLRDAGFGENDLSMLTHATAGKVGELLVMEPERSAATGSLIGLGVGSALGLLGGVTIIPISGTEISLLVSGLMGTAGGGAIGTYLGALYGERSSTNPEYEFKEKLANEDAFLLIAHSDDEFSQSLAIDIMKETEGEHVGVYEVDVQEFEQLTLAE